MKDKLQIETKLDEISSMAMKEKELLVELDNLRIYLSRNERLGIILALRWVLCYSEKKQK